MQMDRSMTRYHPKKRIDIIVESPLVRIIAGKLDEEQVSGYSVLPVLQGRGTDNAWNSEGQVSDTANMVALFCIVDASRADRVVDAVLATIRDRIGFVTISDVMVVRPERF
jgi:nitrogen regulatory protein PII